jgi:hypothetical protein
VPLQLNGLARKPLASPDEDDADPEPDSGNINAKVWNRTHHPTVVDIQVRYDMKKRWASAHFWRTPRKRITLSPQHLTIPTSSTSQEVISAGSSANNVYLAGGRILKKRHPRESPFKKQRYRHSEKAQKDAAKIAVAIDRFYT